MRHTDAKRTLQGWGLQVEGPLAGEIRALAPWFHNLHLPGGTQTAPDHPLGDHPAGVWRELAGALPADLHGAAALDIGCNAGFYSFALAERGARVLGIDSSPHYLRQATWARAQLGLQQSVELRQLDVYELANLHQRFDLVLFCGVLYHLRYPLLALDIVADKVGGQLLLQSLTMPGRGALQTAGYSIADRHRLLHEAWPKMSFIEHELAGDDTNWWVPNGACLEALLRSAGLQIVQRLTAESYLCRPGPQRAVREELRSVLSAFGGPSLSADR